MTPITPETHLRLFLAGPMTGILKWNRPAFRAAAAALREAGFQVCDPSENFGGDTTLPRRDYLRETVRQVTEAYALAVLPGWGLSAGARLEVAVARALEMPVVDAATLLPTPPPCPRAGVPAGWVQVPDPADPDYRSWVRGDMRVTEYAAWACVCEVSIGGGSHRLMAVFHGPPAEAMAWLDGGGLVPPPRAGGRDAEGGL
jgi:hypothetical protein